MNREQLFRFFFLGVLIFLIYQILKILSPFYTGILGAIVLTLIFFPMHHFILKRMGSRRHNFAAGLSTTLVMLMIVFPFIVFSRILMNEIATIYPLAQKFGSVLENWRQGNVAIPIAWLQTVETALKGILSDVNLQTILTEVAESVIAGIIEFGKRLPRHAFIFTINMLVMVFTLFFLFRDGSSIFRKFKELVPMDDKHKDHIATQLYMTVTAIVRGVFIVAIAQGASAGIGFAIAGVPSAAVLGFGTIFVALIPLVGAISVWMPVTIYYLSQGDTGKGLFLLVWGTFIVSLVDNFLRPILIGSRTKLPILFLVFGLLGGVKVYGPMGLFLGPLVVALLTAFIKIYREEYQQVVKTVPADPGKGPS